MALATRPAPVWFWGVAALGLCWNAYCVVQYLGSVRATPESLLAAGLTAEQAAVMTSYPGWMTAAFAIGVFAGLLGCVLLLMLRKAALAIFAVSLAGYVALYIGDMIHGVFAALGAPQVIVLTIVLIIAAGLLWTARHATKSAILA